MTKRLRVSCQKEARRDGGFRVGEPIEQRVVAGLASSGRNQLGGEGGVDDEGHQ